MTQYEIIDSHCHIFPDKIALRASQATGDFYNIPMSYDGTVRSLIKSGNRIGVSKYVVHSTATKKEQVSSINNFIFETISAYDCFIGFGTLSKDMDKAGIRSEVEKIISRGLKGIKLHPDFQDFNIDDEKVFAIYETCEGRLPILFHVGDERYDRSSPARLAKTLKRFPGLTAIAAHLGGYQRWDEALETIIGNKNVYIDTCSSLPIISKEKAVDIIRKHGYERVMFGTDYPMWDHKEEKERFDSLELTEIEREAIFSKNAKRLLKIT